MEGLDPLGSGAPATMADGTLGPDCCDCHASQHVCNKHGSGSVSRMRKSLLPSGYLAAMMYRPAYNTGHLKVDLLRRGRPRPPRAG
jgi:hypothetical protein